MATPRARLLLAGLAVSVVGDGAAKIALLLRVHDAGAGSSGLAVLLVLFVLPVVLLVGVAGALADRMDPRPVVVAAGALQLLASVALVWRTDLVSTGVSVIVLQTGFALGNSAWVVALPRVVGEEHVGALVSLHHALLALAAPLGAALGGVLAQHAGDRAPFVLNALTFVPLVLVGTMLPVRDDGTVPTAPRGLLRTLVPVEGVRALGEHPLLARIVWAVLPFIIALESVNAIEVFLVKDVLGGSSSQFGAAEAAAGVAAVVGALAAALLRTTRTRAMAILAVLGLISLCQVGQGLAPSLLVYVPLAASVGLLLGMVNALVLTLMVTATDIRARGSIVAFVGGTSRSCGIIALGVGGLLGSVLDPRTAYVLVGLVGLSIAAGAVLAVRGGLAPPAVATPPFAQAPSADLLGRADCGHVDEDGDGHRPRQRSRGGVASQRRPLPGQDRDHQRGHPAELP